ncbi:hypothetical protein [Sandaracinus amylolyticus]|uniref:Uncharacterized protein n=1 Tax=Sandaracinus amylolyticus TaxID=927083 RepID=A0A0F6YID8_9BACT|nr:hypothetical protein [Sandaracinus amylolyticus]AKF06570.1 hypothetical protein DB32_003719 [Sandaracinus amylolyticus]
MTQNPLVTAERDDETPPPSADAADEPAERAKKERVLHTRVPAVLEQELKRLATNLKMPVSNLVRAILEDALDAVDAVGQRAEGELHGIAERLRVQRDALRSTAVARPARTPADPSQPACPSASVSLEGVIGFQSLVLVADATCTACGRTLRKGTKACRGVREEPGPRVLLGPECELLPSGLAEEDGT